MFKVYEIFFIIEEKEFLYLKLYKFNELDGCYIWYGAIDFDGYGIIRLIFRLKR